MTSLERMSARDTDWDGIRLHVVTGKGGSGKSTAAAALALALAADGRRVLLTEVEGRQGIAQLFDCPPLPYQERKVAVAPGGGDVYALPVDPEEALLEYLQMFYNLRQAGRALTRLGVVDFATAIAPGLRDVLLTGKAAEAVRRRAGEVWTYDAVVMDAPPTGRIARFLNVNAEVAGLARMGPIHTHAEQVMKVIRSPETAVHFVTLLEEMPVQETIDGIEELRDLGLPIGGVVINMVRPPLLDRRTLDAAARRRLDPSELTLGLKTAGLEAGDNTVQALLDELADHATWMNLERRERKKLARLAVPAYDLPLLPDGMDLGGLYRLAAELRTQGAA